MIEVDYGELIAVQHLMKFETDCTAIQRTSTSGIYVPVLKMNLMTRCESQPVTRLIARCCVASRLVTDIAV